MKILTYHISQPIKGICKQTAICGSDGASTDPIAYLQRPKWIKDDSAWRKITDSIKLMLPKGLEIK